MKDGLPSAAIHGNKSQSARTKALADFKANRVRVLVATDIAARGLDIEALPHVVNYELPNVPEDYVHRIGRTGRAGMSGHAVSLVSSDENSYLRDIERLLKKPIERLALPESFVQRAPNARPAAAPEEDRPERHARNARPRRPSSGPGTGARTASRGAPAAKPRHDSAQKQASSQRSRHGASSGGSASAGASAHASRGSESTPRPPRPARSEGDTVRSSLPPHMTGAFRRGR